MGYVVAADIEANKGEYFQKGGKSQGGGIKQWLILPEQFYAVMFGQNIKRE